jgi:hypothetical protein
MNSSRREYITAVGIAGTVGLAGCSDGAAATGTRGTRVTDEPGDISDFGSCVVTIQGIWVKPTGDGTATTADGDSPEDDEDSDDDEADVDESDAREYHEFDEPQEADLVELQDGNTALIDERELETGSYEFLQLDVSDVEGVLADGGEAEVDTPGNAPLQFKQPFEIRDGQTTTFTGDFTPVRRGQTGRYLLQPVASGTRVEYGTVATATDDA